MPSGRQPGCREMRSHRTPPPVARRTSPSPLPRATNQAARHCPNQDSPKAACEAASPARGPRRAEPWLRIPPPPLLGLSAAARRGSREGPAGGAAQAQSARRRSRTQHAAPALHASSAFQGAITAVSVSAAAPLRYLSTLHANGTRPPQWASRAASGAIRPRSAVRQRAQHDQAHVHAA